LGNLENMNGKAEAFAKRKAEERKRKRVKSVFSYRFFIVNLFKKNQLLAPTLFLLFSFKLLAYLSAHEFITIIPAGSMAAA